MIIQTEKQKLYAILLIGAALLMAVMMLLPSPTQALPPRQTATPTPTSSPERSRDDAPTGSHIALHVTFEQAGLWTVVQWQDSAGNWHDVEGWRGTLDEGQKVWWVAQKDFGTGPFRWVVYQSQGGKLLGSSVPFNLPAFPNQTMQVTVAGP
jgi:hypothetical protein